MDSAPEMKITDICRYPVKGLAPQHMEEVSLGKDQTLPLDRSWAIENGRGRFDPEDPQHLPKINFLMLMRNERLAALDIEFDEDTTTLVVLRNGKQVTRGDLTSVTGRQIIEQFMASYMEADLRGAPHIVYADDHSFSDVAIKCVHIVNMASVRDLERVVGKPVDPLRFRANLYFESDAPWDEFNWIGKTITVGDVELEVIDRTTRCAATNVDPQTGQRDLAIPSALTRGWGHEDFGIYATVKSGGTLRKGDTIQPA